MEDEIEYLRDLRRDLQAAMERPEHRRWLSRQRLVFVAPVTVAAAVAAVVAGVVLTSLSSRPAGAQRPAPIQHPAPVPTAGGSHPPLTLGGPLKLPTGPELKAVSAVGPDDIWAVGDRAVVQSSTSTFVIHYDGNAWTPIQVPGIYNPLGIAAVSANDVWVIGGNRHALNWDGSAWSRVSLPRAAGVQLSAISGSGRNDVWVVGNRYGARLPANSIGSHTLAYHFNGSAWTITPTPNPNHSSNGLTDVVAISPTDAWATAYGKSGYTLHWDGTQWHRVSTPTVSGRGHGELNGIGTAGGDIWIVGRSHGPAYGDSLYLRWNGDRWQIVPGTTSEEIPQPSHVSGSSPTDVWADGNDCCGRFVMARYQSGRWRDTTVTVPPGVIPFDGNFNGLVTLSPTDAWAVGVAYKRGKPSGKDVQHRVALVEHWDGRSWKPVAIPGLASAGP